MAKKKKKPSLKTLETLLSEASAEVLKRVGNLHRYEVEATKKGDLNKKVRASLKTDLKAIQQKLDLLRKQA